ncbi:fimbrial protein [Pseudomonas sp. 148P]|uniref:Fimbrial protein n=1 Tax=Pseudomonas ulcerans TaxID=3115852 RepID=A0ABU7HPA6_9PSED|nr:MULTISPECIES: fimbrial protein [unclassified Pseudomonas]MEE1920590.1 fimbrial protein [Pseudomonas sp. 147P]MEE1933372.1 fimbrial protein [Pseudomonas sp. 148P]
MTLPTRALLACAALTLFIHPQARASDPPNPIPDDEEICRWSEIRPPGPSTYTIDIGTYHVPRDAPIGTPIGPVDAVWYGGNDVGAILSCFRWDGPHVLNLHARATAKVFPDPLPPLNGEDLTGRVLETSIPGVGVRLRLAHPFAGEYSNAWRPLGEPIVPFDAVIDHFTQFFAEVAGIRSFITLIKIGPIPPGINVIDGSELWSATASDVGRAWGWRLHGAVIQSQCSLPTNPVSADPVELGEWDSQDFTGPGFATPAVPFTITLSDCEDDPENGVATAHIRLEGALGSQPIDAARGIFGLSDDSSAEGVAIQMLMGDGVTPVQLNQNVPLQAISPSGETVLPFTARYYQTEASEAVKPGSAKGALNFTISYH